MRNRPYTRAFLLGTVPLFTAYIVFAAGWPDTYEAVGAAARAWLADLF